MGWERANYFAPAEAKIEYGFATPGWLRGCRDEQRAARQTPAIFD